jgi:hypothetical protein
MTTGQTIIVVIGVAFLVAVAILVFFAALFGKDIECFESYKTSAPKHYQNLKKVTRVNCLMTSVVCAGGLIGAPLVAFDPEGGVLAALAVFTGSAMGLWLSVRWAVWGWKPY